MQKDFGEIKDVPRAKRQSYVPVVLSQTEINKVVSYLFPMYVFGCGLRISECLNLKNQLALP
jgi:integrase